MVRASDATSQSIQLKNVPSEDLTGISFVIGVDSLRNTMDINVDANKLFDGPKTISIAKTLQ